MPTTGVMPSVTVKVTVVIVRGSIASLKVAAIFLLTRNAGIGHCACNRRYAVFHCKGDGSDRQGGHRLTEGNGDFLVDSHTRGLLAGSVELTMGMVVFRYGYGYG